MEYCNTLYQLRWQSVGLMSRRSWVQSPHRANMLLTAIPKKHYQFMRVTSYTWFHSSAGQSVRLLIARSTVRSRLEPSLFPNSNSSKNHYQINKGNSNTRLSSRVVKGVALKMPCESFVGSNPISSIFQMLTANQNHYNKILKHLV